MADVCLEVKEAPKSLSAEGAKSKDASNITDGRVVPQNRQVSGAVRERIVTASLVATNSCNDIIRELALKGKVIETTLPRAVEAARAMHRNVLTIVTAPWCPPCHELEALLNAPLPLTKEYIEKNCPSFFKQEDLLKPGYILSVEKEVRTLREKFVIVKVDYETTRGYINDHYAAVSSVLPFVFSINSESDKTMRTAWGFASWNSFHNKIGPTENSDVNQIKELSEKYEQAKKKYDQDSSPVNKKFLIDARSKYFLNSIFLVRNSGEVEQLISRFEREMLKDGTEEESYRDLLECAGRYYQTVTKDLPDARAIYEKMLKRPYSTDISSIYSFYAKILVKIDGEGTGIDFLIDKTQEECQRAAENPKEQLSTAMDTISYQVVIFLERSSNLTQESYERISDCLERLAKDKGFPEELRKHCQLQRIYVDALIALKFEKDTAKVHRLFDDVLAKGEINKYMIFENYVEFCKGSKVSGSIPLLKATLELYKRDLSPDEYKKINSSIDAMSSH